MKRPKKVDRYIRQCLNSKAMLSIDNRCTHKLYLFSSKKKKVLAKCIQNNHKMREKFPKNFSIRVQFRFLWSTLKTYYNFP